MLPTDSPSKSAISTFPARESFDVAIIGAGVVGCAIARSFAIRGWSTLVLEKAADILEGASKGNSALLHTGYDAAPDGVELRMVTTGAQIYRRIHARMNLPLFETGALVVAWTEPDRAALDGIVALAHRNGVAGAKIIGRDELQRREPNLSAAALAAVSIPGEAVIDPWTAPLGYLTQALLHGATLVRNAELLKVTPSSTGWRLTTCAGGFSARLVINAAGLFGDRVEALRGRAPSFTIRPRKGQFVIYDKPAFDLVRSIILKVPTDRTKGVLLAPTVFGNLLAGPTAEDQEDRLHARCDEPVLRQIRAEAEVMVPRLANQEVVTSFAGLRPATEHRDYVLAVDHTQHWITVGGIRSTGLSAALGLGEWATEQGSVLLGEVRRAPPDDDLDWPTMPDLSHLAARADCEADQPPIACRCEWVTAGEIEAALGGPIPAGTVGGLKRRTRVMMGRCQGFGCVAAVAQMAPGLLPQPEEAVK